MLVHLPWAEGYGTIPPTKNGPTLGGYGAVAMKDALATTMIALLDQLRRSLTWDRGKGLAAHTQLTVETGLHVYFADPHAPPAAGQEREHQRLLRQYFPKGTDLSRWSTDERSAIAAVLNSRPRKTLSWKTPAEPLDEHL